MSKIISAISLTALGILLTVGIMVYGWGLTPQSWWWIIGGGFGLRLIIAAFEVLAKEK